MRPRSSLRSLRLVARHRIAMNSDATTMSKPSSRGTPWHAVAGAAEPDHDVPQGAVVDVDHAPPGDAAHVEPELVALLDVIVDEGCEQVVGERDGGEVAGEVQVDVFHRHHLRVTAAGGAALHAEYRPERRPPRAHEGALAEPVQRITEPDRGGGLALPGRGRGDRGDQDQLALGTVSELGEVIERYFGLVVTVGLET